MKKTALKVLSLIPSTFSLIVLLTALACLLLMITWQAKLCGIVLLLLYYLLKRMAAALSGSRVLRLRTAGILILFILAGIGTLDALRPRGRAGISEGIASNFSPSRRFPLIRLLMLVPERDQVYLGTYLAGFLDRLMDYTQAKRLREMSDEYYSRMAADPAFRELEPALFLGYLDLLGAHPKQGHLYYYQPPQSKNKKLPLLVFAHGDAGNFMTYAWLFKQFADTHGFIVVQPTFGFGIWGRPGAVETVLDAKRYALEQLNVDSERIYLAALSGGGVVASKIAREHPQEFHSIGLISPLPDHMSWLSPDLAHHWQDREMLVIHGSRDKRIPITYIRNLLNGFELEGGRVKLVSLEEDHLLLYTRWERVMEELAQSFTRP